MLAHIKLISISCLLHVLSQSIYDQSSQVEFVEDDKQENQISNRIKLQLLQEVSDSIIIDCQPYQEETQEQQFQRLWKLCRGKDKKLDEKNNSTQEQKYLKLLSIGRQGAEGDVQGKKPFFNKFERKVYEEWEKIKGKDQFEAKEEFLGLAVGILQNQNISTEDPNKIIEELQFDNCVQQYVTNGKITLQQAEQFIIKKKQEQEIKIETEELNKNRSNKNDKGNKIMKTWLITAAIAIISAIISFLIVYCFSDRKKNIRNKFEDISEVSINQQQVISQSSKQTAASNLINHSVRMSAYKTNGFTSEISSLQSN